MEKRKVVCLALLPLLVFTALIFMVTLTEAAEGKIVIGVLEPLSGPLKDQGERFVLGAKYAVEELNAKGGLMGKEVSLVVEDTNYKPDVAIRRATKLILEDKADILVGSLGSHICLAIMKVAEKYNKIFVIPNSEAASITGKDFNPYVFRTTPSTGQRTSAIISYLSKNTKFKKFYILCMDFALGREAGDGFREKVSKIPGAQLVGEDYHPLMMKDFAPYVSKIIASGAEVVLTTNLGPDLSNLIKTGKSLGWKAITAGGYLFDPVMMQDVQDAALGHLVFNHSLIDLNNPLQRKFVQDFKERYKSEDPIGYSPVFGVNDYYYGMQWLFDAIKRAGSTDSAKMIKAWEGASYNMPWGKVTMRACDHQIITPYKAGPIVRDNEFFSFPFIGKLITIPEEEVTVSQTQVENPRCK
ncbi:MAG TPA: ABC transporter substrate-binding protein [Thermodesulfobacteriota bacterium]|nr:ABC transporter substrate-binding protein [Thermodesulfobacteriota bacterium]